VLLLTLALLLFVFVFDAVGGLASQLSLSRLFFFAVH